jgi:hypothetical protein
MPFDLGFLYIVVQVILLEGILSIDNAAVLGAMVSVNPRSTISSKRGIIRHKKEEIYGSVQLPLYTRWGYGKPICNPFRKRVDPKRG